MAREYGAGGQSEHGCPSEGKSSAGEGKKGGSFAAGGNSKYFLSRTCPLTHSFLFKRVFFLSNGQFIHSSVLAQSLVFLSTLFIISITMAQQNGVPDFTVKAGLAQMLKGGVIMDVVNAEQVCSQENQD